ncbi:serine protease [Pseudonocardiaceae bacterium YIM PH 21723]|nr:serine protease [Pseudonocardiaceae bacterium YIM PH 21723]
MTWGDLMRRVLAVVAAVLLMFGAGAPAQAIIGGEEAAEPYSFMATFIRDGEQHCGATLITDRWLVTAAHCAMVTPDRIQVRLGALDWTTAPSLPTDRVVLHPGYKIDENYIAHDIGLVRLAEPVRNRPAVIAPRPAAGTPIRLLGWGMTCPDENDPGCAPPKRLRQLESRLLPESACANDPSFQRGHFRCVDNRPEASSCGGDSGAPALVKFGNRWLVTGATSHGAGRGLCNEFPGVYTDVSAYLPWILRTIAQS